MDAKYCPVADLPDSIRVALSSVGYGKKDIAISAKPEVSIQASGGNGYQAFVVLLNLVTGESETIHGSWGGDNPWSKSQVDKDGRNHVLPVDGVVIQGQHGGGHPVLASITIHPDRMVKMLPASAAVTERESRILAIFRGLKSAYRGAYLSDAKVVQSEIESLIQRKFLSRNKAGAISITTEGKNNASRI